MGHDVFISYASVDKLTADAVCEALEADGTRCWIAPRDVISGVRFAKAIVDAIRASQVLVLVFSSSAIASVQVEREVDRAVASKLPILPFRIEDVVPSESLEYYLAGQHWLDAFSPAPEAHLGALAEAVRTLLEPGSGERRGRTESAPAASPREERRVVTALACDLVGFAAACDDADPEDVDAALRRYEALVRSAAEAYGGVVDQSAGDSIIAAFGVPVVHEDDHERAVRAGLRMVREADGLSGPIADRVDIRVGIDTGEALVRLPAEAGTGEASLAGQILGRAAQYLSAASPGEVVVGEATFSLTRKAIDYAALEPVVPAGRGEPLPVWRARGPRSRTGMATSGVDLAPLVDREIELARLTTHFEEAVGSSSPHVALITGELGIGKSRLVAELFAYVEARPELVTWRQGRCPPYGEGLTFWALSEIVKEQAGILETDDSATAGSKLEQVVPEGPDRSWMLSRLRALLGYEAPPASREENFGAWLRFLEDLAASGPSVFVIEDLHWADEASLAFFDYFAANVDGVPLLMIGTARPELFEDDPGFAASTARIDRIALNPLTKGDTERLIAGLVGTLDVPDGAVEEIVDRTDGNPFYVQETVQLLRDRLRVEGGGRAGDEGTSGEVVVEEAPLPQSVQSVIAARLDTLPGDHKTMLRDAAVIGQVFWDGAVCTLGDRSLRETDGGLRGLAGKRLVHRVRDSSMENETEYAFWNTLVRDVAYQQLPRATRATRHAAAAAWIEDKAGERVAEVAEILAYHNSVALDLARAVGETGLADRLQAEAVRCLSLAGDRALALDGAAAERQYARALALVGDETPDRPRLLACWARALFQRGRFRECADAYEQAIEGLRSAGDRRAAAVALKWRARSLSELGDHGFRDVAAEAVALLDGDDPSPELVEVLSGWASIVWLEGDAEAAIAAAERALAISRDLGLPEPVETLGCLGGARCDLGDPRGLEDLARALGSAKATGLGIEAALLAYNYGSMLNSYEGPRTALAVHLEALDEARRRGNETFVLGLRSAVVEDRAWSGEWDEALSEVTELAPVLEEAEDVYSLVVVRTEQVLLLARRGDARSAEPHAVWALEKGRDSSLFWIVAYCLHAAAVARFALGDGAGATGLLDELRGMASVVAGPEYAQRLPEAVRLALAAGRPDLAERLVDGVQATQPVHEHALATATALLCEARGDIAEAVEGFREAADRWEGFGEPYEQAQALLGEGRCRAALAGASAAEAPLTSAQAILAALGAAPAAAEAERLLTGVGGE